MQLLPVDAIKTISTHNRISKGLFVGLFLTLVCFLPEMAMAQSKGSSAPLTRILFVFDGSQSMYGRWKTGQKIKVAQKLLSELLDSISYRQDIQLSLRVYGHQSPVISRENHAVWRFREFEPIWRFKNREGACCRFAPFDNFPKMPRTAFINNNYFAD